MKIRSKALYNHLVETNVLNGTVEEIARAKQAYRKHYKQQWKINSAAKKEIRFTVTLKQYEAVIRKAEIAKVLPTTCAKQTLLQTIGQPVTPHPQLLQVLQLVSMATIAIQHNAPVHHIYDLITRAEIELLSYLHHMQ